MTMLRSKDSVLERKRWNTCETQRHGSGGVEELLGFCRASVDLVCIICLLLRFRIWCCQMVVTLVTFCKVQPVVVVLLMNLAVSLMVALV
jgi:hypothetical protein